MYKVLSEDIMVITENQTIVEHLEQRQKTKEKLATFIYRHSLLLKTVKFLQSLYKLPTGIDLSANAVCICLAFVVPLSEGSKFMTTTLYCLGDFFLYCFLCQKLENASESFENAIYCCGWEKLCLSDQKSILIMLIQAQRPISIKAAGIIPLRMYTYASTMQSIYKFGAAFKI